MCVLMHMLVCACVCKGQILALSHGSLLDLLGLLLNLELASSANLASLPEELVFAF